MLSRRNPFLMPSAVKSRKPSGVWITLPTAVVHTRGIGTNLRGGGIIIPGGGGGGGGGNAAGTGGAASVRSLRATSDSGTISSSLLALAPLALAPLLLVLALPPPPLPALLLLLLLLLSPSAPSLLLLGMRLADLFCSLRHVDFRRSSHPLNSGVATRCPGAGIGGSEQLGLVWPINSQFVHLFLFLHCVRVVVVGRLKIMVMNPLPALSCST